jgi:hypothetical protein
MERSGNGAIVINGYIIFRLVTCDTSGRDFDSTPKAVI